MKPDGAAPLSAVDDAVPPIVPCIDGGPCPLDALACGRAARVVSLRGAPRIVRRLLALGVRPSTRCQVLGRAPNGGPIHLRAGSVHLMVRASEAAEVLVQPDVEPEGRDVLPAL
jgi:Fe2+ transport system protein FeoA